MDSPKKNILSEKRTKIVATIGPASNSEKILKELVRGGMNVTRLNFSHNDYEWHKSAIDNIRKVSKEMHTPIGIMVDLQGPRIRVGNSKEICVKKGDEILVSEKNKNNINELIIDCSGIVSALKKEDRILIEDGLIKLEVISKSKLKNQAKAKVLAGGTIKPRKGVNIPDTKLKVSALTKKDIKDLEFALRNKVDFVAMSFVSNDKEVERLRKIIKKICKQKKNLPQIVSKIERKEAIKNIRNIIKASDVIMVARGDLGIEMPESRVVIYQKEIISDCLHIGRPVIVATQMLESMIKNPIPTRAEVSDVSNAVIDHADAVMLSGETAFGKYPVETVRIMREIIEKTEQSPFDDLEHGFLGDKKSSVSAAVAHSAHELSKDSNSKAIVVASISGFTARMVSRHRPDQKIYVMTNNEKTHNQLSIVWGVESFVLPLYKTLEDLISNSIQIIKKNKLVFNKDKVVIVAGRPHIKREHMSLVKVEEID